MIRRLLPSAAVAEEQVAEPVGPPPERYWWLWLLLLLLLVVGGLLAWYFLSRGDDKAVVPNVIGLQQQQAETRIQEEDLEPLPHPAPSNRPQGVVFAEKPGAGTQLGKGQTVTIFVSTGRLGIPDVVGLELPEAQQKLEARGFKVEVKRVASTKPKGIVLDQDPAAGVTALSGTTVTLSVSSGAKPVVVPRVVGQTQGDAVQALTALGLKPVLQNVPSDKPAGTVVGQKPPAGKEVDKGAEVTVNVSTGSGPATTTTTTTTTASTPLCRARPSAESRGARTDAGAQPPQRAGAATDRRLRELEPAGEQGRLAIAGAGHLATTGRARAGERVDRAEPPAEHGCAERRRPGSGNGSADAPRRGLQGRGAEPTDRRPVQGRPRGRAAAAREREHSRRLAGHDLHRALLRLTERSPARLQPAVDRPPQSKRAGLR